MQLKLSDQWEFQNCRGESANTYHGNLRALWTELRHRHGDRWRWLLLLGYHGLFRISFQLLGRRITQGSGSLPLPRTQRGGCGFCQVGTPPMKFGFSPWNRVLISRARQPWTHPMVCLGGGSTGRSNHVNFISYPGWKYKKAVFGRPLQAVTQEVDSFVCVVCPVRFGNASPKTHMAFPPYVAGFVGSQLFQNKTIVIAFPKTFLLKRGTT